MFRSHRLSSSPSTQIVMMTKFISSQLIARLILVAACFALIDRKSDALFLGNIIGCNSFGCRISALEADVGQLKQQVARLTGTTGDMQNPYRNPQNQFGTQMGMNQLGGLQTNQGQPGGQQGQQGQQQQQQQPGTNTNGAAQGADPSGNVNRANYGNLVNDFQLRRVAPNYPNANQFFGA